MLALVVVAAACDVNVAVGDVGVGCVVALAAGVVSLADVAAYVFVWLVVAVLLVLMLMFWCC